MKLNKIKKAMTRQTLSIINGSDGFQWIGDGTAYYEADRELDLTESNLLAILDIDADKRDQYTVREIDGARVPMCDVCPQEACDVELIPRASVSWAGELLTIMTTNDGEAVAVTQRQIAPADGKKPLRFFLRRSVDRETAEIRQPVVAVFEDMLCCAVIMPIEARTMAAVWDVMRASCDMALRYCAAAEEDAE